MAYQALTLIMAGVNDGPAGVLSNYNDNLTKLIAMLSEVYDGEVPPQSLAFNAGNEQLFYNGTSGWLQCSSSLYVAGDLFNENETHLATLYVSTGAGAGKVAVCGDGDGTLAWQHLVTVINVKNYGAAGDGVTDDSDAWIAWLAAINAAGGNCVAYVPPGTYLIDRHLGDGGGKTQANFAISGCSNFTISGYGARIVMGGGYTRATGTVEPLSPFWFDGCSDFAVEGFEADGNVETLLQPAGTTQIHDYAPAGAGPEDVPPDFANSANDNSLAWFKEPYSSVIWMRLPGASGAAAWTQGATVSVGDEVAMDGSDWRCVATIGEPATGHLFYVKNSRRYTFRDCYAHHGPADGFYLGGSSTPDEDACLVNCKAHWNARTGLVIAQVRGWTVQGGSYSGNGFTGGTDSLWRDGSATTPGESHVSAYGFHSYGAGIDVEPTSAPDAEGYKCRAGVFVGVTCRNNLGVQYICGTYDKAEDVTWIGGAIEAGTSGVRTIAKLYIPQQVMQGVAFQGDQINPDITSTASTSTTLRDCRIRTGYRGLVSTADKGRIVLENCDIEGTHTATLATPMLYLQNSNAYVRNCRFHLPVAADGAASYRACYLQNIRESAGNEFRTDAATGHFYNDYGTTPVKGDRFISGDFWRPYVDATWDETYPYTVEGGAKIGYGTAAPVAGAWAVGDRIINTAPAAGGYLGWVCTAGGSPGTWKGYGAIAA